MNFACASVGAKLWHYRYVLALHCVDRRHVLDLSVSCCRSRTAPCIACNPPSFFTKELGNSNVSLLSSLFSVLSSPSLLFSPLSSFSHLSSVSPHFCLLFLSVCLRPVSSLFPLSLSLGLPSFCVIGHAFVWSDSLLSILFWDLWTVGLLGTCLGKGDLYVSGFVGEPSLRSHFCQSCSLFSVKTAADRAETIEEHSSNGASSNTCCRGSTTNTPKAEPKTEYNEGNQRVR